MSLRPDSYLVDILLRGWEGLELTRRLLASLRANTPAELYRVTYVDNGSEIMHLADLLAEFPEVQLVRLPFNHGSCRALNLGLASANLTDAPFMLLLDNDTEIPAGDREWLARWLSYCDDPVVGAAGAVTDYVAGAQQAEAVPDRYQREWIVGAEHGAKDLRPQPLLVSFGMLLRKTAVQQVGLFDERFEPGNCEDYDYSLRLVAAGWKNVVAESVWLHHVGSQTFRRLEFDRLLQTNYRKLVDKWGVQRLAELGVSVRARPA